METFDRNKHLAQCVRVCQQLEAIVSVASDWPMADKVDFMFQIIVSHAKG